MPLLLNDLPPLNWAVAGAGLAAITLLLLFVGNIRLGISTGLEDIRGLVLGRHQRGVRDNEPNTRYCDLDAPTDAAASF